MSNVNVRNAATAAVIAAAATGAVGVAATGAAAAVAAVIAAAAAVATGIDAKTGNGTPVQQMLRRGFCFGEVAIVCLNESGSP